MAYTVEYSPLMDDEDVKRTLAKLHVAFIMLPFMSMKQVLKIVITNVNTAEVYTKNGNIHYFEAHQKHNDRLEQVTVKEM
ncbi:hypothetical protein KM915_21030 [Cytobacillus oceanisediminis]|uniref:hypothetical protein n=1 Tax=Cytobacillus oceanisediminis TaxID=665099 RepID=UPI001C21F97C|nr:hypothetical protein [Cytobacillus oceanisediminis]MBU8732536.1 hypothetical protein [Cytobacillus oceanisediminis]